MGVDVLELILFKVLSYGKYLTKYKEEYFLMGSVTCGVGGFARVDLHL
jgi:hypothetical protein